MITHTHPVRDPGGTPVTAVLDEVGAEGPVSVADEGVTECASRWVRIEVGSWFERLVATP